MAEIGDNSHRVEADQLKSYVSRIELLAEARAAMSEEMSEVRKEAKAAGFNTKVLNRVIAQRKRDRDERLEEEALYDLYMSVLD